jgi:hypothetical protein
MSLEPRFYRLGSAPSPDELFHPAGIKVARLLRSYAVEAMAFGAEARKIHRSSPLLVQFNGERRWERLAKG